MIGSFCTTLILHFSKRFDYANIHFSIETHLSILHFFHILSTFQHKEIFEMKSQIKAARVYFPGQLLSIIGSDYASVVTDTCCSTLIGV